MFYEEKGFIFLEVLIATALIGIVFITLLGIGIFALNISFSLQKSAEIDALMKESLEATRSFRDGTTWSTNGLGTILIGSGNTYYFVLDNTPNPPKWSLTSGTETIGVFTRKIFFDKVSRNPSTKDIESTYNSVNDDPNTRKVTVSITFDSKTSQVITYLTNWK